MTSYSGSRQVHSRTRFPCLLGLLFSLLTIGVLQAQQPSASSPATTALPRLLRFSGTATDLTGKPLTGLLGITFSLYSEQTGGSPLWLETQNVQADGSGHYTVLLGSTQSKGLPADLFTSEKAHWVGVQVSGQAEHTRALLVSAPYALKAGDAETVGGLPASAFVLAAPNGGSAGSEASGNSSLNSGSQPPVGGSGTQNFIPLWTDNSGTLGNSVIFQSGTGSSAKTGVNTTTPASTLDVNGSVIARGPVQLPSTGTATAGTGFNSQPFSLQGSSFNSSNQQAIGPIFQWQTEPTGNNSSNPAGTLNLLYGNGSGSPGETGLNIASNGKITFATGQAFPGTGTITGITAGTGLTGGGTSGTVTLSINIPFANQFYAQLAAANTFAKNQTVNANLIAKQLISTAAQGTAPLQVTSTTQVPNLNASLLGGLSASAFQPTGSYATLGSNSFTGNQSVTGNVTASGTVSGSTANFSGVVTEAGALLPASGTATTSQGYNSQPLDAVTSAYNSSTASAVNQDFQWLAEPVGNNTSSPSGKLDLLFGASGAIPAETGVSIASNGQITFATGQTFPGTGNGTITGVTAGTDLIGGGGSGNVTLNLDTTKVVTGVTAGTDLTGGGTGGVQTLNLDVTKVPELGSNNTFTGTEQFSVVGIGAAPNPNGWTPLALGSTNSFGTWVTLANTSSGGHTWNILSAGSGNSEGAGNLGITDFTGASKIFLEGNVNAASLTTTGTVNGGVVNAASGFNLAGSPFVTGSYGIVNAFFGFNVGNSTMTGGNNLAVGAGTFWQNTTGNQNTALGEFSLYHNTTGALNTATGYNSLSANTTGIDNTASGTSALLFNSTGNYNSAQGYGALYTNSTGSNNTALGFEAGAPPDQSQITGSNNTFVGSFANVSGTNETTISNATAIGANAQVAESNALVLGSIKGVNGASANTFVGIGTTAPGQSLEVDFGNSLVRGTNNFQKDGDTAYLFLGDTNNFIQVTHGTGLTLGTFNVPTAVRINQYSGFVGIGTTAPDNTLSVNGSADKPGGGSWGTFSDARLKNLNGGFSAGLSQLMKLHPIRYRYKEDNAMGIRDHDEHVGFVAQEVQRVIPEAVTENSKGYLLVNNDPILWTMLNAIKEQQKEIAGLRSQLRMRPSSTAKPVAAPAAYDSAKDQELRTVRRQLHQLRTKDTRLEARLTRLEHALTALGPQTITLASAAKPAADASGTEGEIYASPSR